VPEASELLELARAPEPLSPNQDTGS
jgi:hypothetical protein